MSKPVEKWYLLRKGEKTGPYTRKQLAWYVRQGFIEKDSLLWKDSLPDWIAAEEVPGLFPEKQEEKPSPDPKGAKGQKAKKDRSSRSDGQKKSRKKWVSLAGGVVVVLLLLFFFSGTGSSPGAGDLLSGFVLRTFPAIADYAPAVERGVGEEEQHDQGDLSPGEEAPGLPPERQTRGEEAQPDPVDDQNGAPQPRGLLTGDFETIIGSWRSGDEEGDSLYFRFTREGVVQVANAETGLWGETFYQLQEASRTAYLLSFYQDEDETWKDSFIVELLQDDELSLLTPERDDGAMELERIRERNFAQVRGSLEKTSFDLILEK